MNVVRPIDSTQPAPQPARRGSVDQGFLPWHFFVLASLMAATAAVIMSRQARPEHLILISMIIASAGFAAAGFYRMLAPLVSDDLLNRARLSVIERARPSSARRC
jgi:hypothetical protein